MPNATADPALEGVWIERPSEEPNVMRLDCPSCRSITEKRRDSLALGLHVIMCVPCGFTSTGVKETDGTVHAQRPEDHR